MGRTRFFGSLAQASIRIGNFAGLLDAETISIGNLAPSQGGKTYEWDNNVSVLPGNILVTIGASGALSAIALRDAINANKPAPGVTAFIDPKDSLVVRIEADARGALGNMALVETMVDAANTVSGATLLGGENALNQVLARGEYIVTAEDVLAGNVMIGSGLPSTARFSQVDVLTSTGVVKFWDGTSSISGTRLRLDGTGAVNFVAGDKVSWVLWE